VFHFFLEEEEWEEECTENTENMKFEYLLVIILSMIAFKKHKVGLIMIITPGFMLLLIILVGTENINAGRYYLSIADT